MPVPTKKRSEREILFGMNVLTLQQKAICKYGQEKALQLCQQECDRLKQDSNPNVRRMAGVTYKLPWVNVLSPVVTA